MLKNISKISKHTTFFILAIIISGLLNFCLFAFQARATESIKPLKLNLTYDISDNCLTKSVPEPEQTVNYPSAPMPECCLRQNRNFGALVNTAVDKSAPDFTGPIISWPLKSYAENNLVYNIYQNIYPPPSALALASTVIRE